jgi:hypothetical protein
VSCLLPPCVRESYAIATKVADASNRRGKQSGGAGQVVVMLGSSPFFGRPERRALR